MADLDKARLSESANEMERVLICTYILPGTQEIKSNLPKLSVSEMKKQAL
jgi:hypothetical protein